MRHQIRGGKCFPGKEDRICIKGQKEGRSLPRRLMGNFLQKITHITG